MDLALMEHQQKFCADYTSDFLALIGGFGAGKTKAFCYKTIIMAGLNAGYEGAIAEPTNYLTRTHLIPNMEEALVEMKIPFDFEKSIQVFHLHFKEGTAKIYCLSGENYQRLVGYNLAFFGSDETDTSGHEIAQEMWKKAISRVRMGPHRQIYSTSTPEGYKFLYDFFIEQPTKAGVLKSVERDGTTIETFSEMEIDGYTKVRRTIHASSYDNPFMDKSFISSMKQNYSEAQWKVWALGQFGNLHNNRVYESYDRELNDTEYTVKNGGPSCPLHIGMDFNIDNMAAIVHIVKDNLPYAVDELVGLRDVPAMIRAIKEKYSQHPIIVYPDASGKNRSPVGVDTSISMLKNAGFKIVVDPSNPAVGDRINSMNAMFCNANGERRYKVNKRQCPTYVRSLEKQAWVDGQPDKSNNIDHPLDAGGYLITKLYPIKGRATLRTY